MSIQPIDRTEVKLKAKSILTGNWPISVGVTIVYFIAIFLVDFFIGFLGAFGVFLNIFIASALSLSLIAFFVNSIKANFFSLKHFRINIVSYFKIILFTFLTSLSFIPYIIFLIHFFDTSNFLWIILALISICFAVYISLIFFAVPYILIESDGKKGLIDSMKESYYLTKDYVLDLLLFILSFLGWQIVCIFSLGIGFLWLMPYMYVAQYIYLKKLKSIKFSEIDFIKLD